MNVIYLTMVTIFNKSRKIVILATCILVWTIHNPYLSKNDSYWYIAAGKAIKTNQWTKDYVWNRTPGYPAIVALSLFAQKHFILVLAAVQTVAMTYSFIYLVREVAKKSSESQSSSVVWKAAKTSGLMSVILLGGYGSSVLPQSTIFVCLCWTIIFLIRCKQNVYTSRLENIILISLMAVFFCFHPICSATLAICYQGIQFESLCTRWRLVVRGNDGHHLYKLLLAPFCCVLMFAAWGNFAESHSKEQSENRIKLFDLSQEDLTNASHSGVITRDPIFLTSVINPALKIEMSRLTEMPNVFFTNLIDTPRNGANVYMGFKRLWTKEKYCISVPSDVLLTVSPGLFDDLSVECRNRFSSIPDKILQPLTNTIYGIVWFASLIFLLFSLMQIFRKDIDSVILAVPIVFLLIYTVIQAQEDRYGAPALPILLFTGFYSFLRFYRTCLLYLRKRLFWA
jgi:hypothetical protein